MAAFSMKQIRELTGLNRTKFCEKYGIPMRTVDDWENERHDAPDYILDLLERAVRVDEGKECVFVVCVREGNVLTPVYKSFSRRSAIERAEAAGGEVIIMDKEQILSYPVNGGQNTEETAEIITATL